MMNSNYFQELKAFKPLPDEQVTALAIQAQQGDEDALKHLLHANLRLVIHYAKKYHKAISDSKIFELGDLISEGNIGLMQSVKAYDPAREVKFSYFAGFYIKRAMIDFLIRNISAIKSPYKLRKKDSAIQKKLDSLQQEISPEELRQLGGFSEDEINHFYHKPFVSYMPEHFDARGEEEEDETEATTDRLKIALRHLEPRERRILKQVHGIECERMTYAAIGQIENLTKQRVRQIEMTAMSKLRAIMKGRKDV